MDFEKIHPVTIELANRDGNILVSVIKCGSQETSATIKVVDFY